MGAQPFLLCAHAGMVPWRAEAERRPGERKEQYASANTLFL